MKIDAAVWRLNSSGRLALGAGAVAQGPVALANDVWQPQWFACEAVDFLEARDGETRYLPMTTRTPSELRSHLLENHKDPKYRHIFVQSGDSRAPLNCSRESFSNILAFHQISPSFLDFVYSFGYTTLPKDYSMTGFLSEDTLDVAKDDALNIPRLGRSGCEHRVSYLLRSVERTEEEDDSDTTEKKWPWRVRQMAVYHSFDFVTGRSLWLNIKANDLMKESITEAVTDLPELKASSIEDLGGGFNATLTTHLIFLEWCDSNWRRCINDFEKDLSAILIKAKTARLDQKHESTAIRDAVKRAMSLRSHGTFQKNGEQGISRSQTIVGSLRTSSSSIFSKVQRTMTKLTDRVNSSPLPTAVAQPVIIPPTNTTKNVDELKKEMDRLKELEMFSFGELQKLHHMGELLEEMRLVINLDMQALRDIGECYSSLMKRDELPKEIHADCKRRMAEFLRKVDRIAKNLEIRLTQLESMTSWLKDGKALFDGILQFRSVQINQILTVTANEQAHNMQEIANKTEQETESMHIITFVTLAFLPGTFVASGLFEWQPGGNSFNRKATTLPGRNKPCSSGLADESPGLDLDSLRHQRAEQFAPQSAIHLRSGRPLPSHRVRSGGIVAGQPISSQLKPHFAHHQR
ncbi:hypothetical protein G7Z17_g4548 [Cylindrodendrum hubeiense]|uniref:CorA-like transporter domain-containing protein n=1 Tax=Cylindrodendrum hubeiense TaxID=595255 RepID=A0A9P5HGP3_9HYPO|nr:hypothetical protein G7Z17_g4548 [Cylindrodendrum hubeiense]